MFKKTFSTGCVPSDSASNKWKIRINPEINVKYHLIKINSLLNKKRHTENICRRSHKV